MRKVVSNYLIKRIETLEAENEQLKNYKTETITMMKGILAIDGPNLYANAKKVQNVLKFGDDKFFEIVTLIKYIESVSEEYNIPIKAYDD